MSMDSDVDLIREIARDVFGGVEGSDLVEVGMERLWPTVVELGWPLVGIDEAQGGSGGSLLELGALAGMLGRHGAAIPLIEQALASWMLASAGHPVPTDVVTVANPHDCALTTTDTAVSGRAHAVPWATHASRAVLTAEVDGTARPVIVDLASAGLSRHDEVTVAGEPRSDLDVQDVSMTVLGNGPNADALFQRAALLSTAALVGAMEEAFELTRIYVTEREQFGRPLSRLQVVESSLAEMSSHVSLARSALDMAIQALARDSPCSDMAVASARVVSVEVTSRVGELAHLLHGAMGITREYALHRSTRRIWSWRDEWGGERWWRRSLGELALAAGSDQFWDEVTVLSAGSP